MRLSLAVSDLYPSHTTLVIGPLHKERNEAPMLHPQPVIGMYMICNLHTQARDVGRTVYLSADEVSSSAQPTSHQRSHRVLFVLQLVNPS